MQNQAPGYSRKHPHTPSEARKKPGQKRGQPGTTRGCPTPDDERVYTAQRCRTCRSSRLKDLGEETTYETELVPATTKVTKHRQHHYRCEDCGEETLALPQDGHQPTEWGPLAQVEMVLGKVLDRLPYRKLIARMVRMGGKLFQMSPATAQAIVWRASERLSEEEQALLQRLRASPFVHVDESIFRADGHREWIWVFVTKEDLLLVIRDSRARDVPEEVLGKDYAGTIICDGWKAYFGWVLQRCWAHLLRYGKEAAEKSEEGKRLYAKLCALYEKLTRNLEKTSACARVRRLRRGTKALKGRVSRYRKSEDATVQRAVTYLENGMPWWLTFLGAPGMEPTNNPGERGLREPIVIRKIIGTLRNEEGATHFTRLLSVLGTWALKGEDVVAKLLAVLSLPS